MAQVLIKHTRLKIENQVILNFFFRLEFVLIWAFLTPQLGYRILNKKQEKNQFLSKNLKSFLMRLKEALNVSHY